MDFRFPVFLKISVLDLKHLASWELLSVDLIRRDFNLWLPRGGKSSDLFLIIK